MAHQERRLLPRQTSPMSRIHMVEAEDNGKLSFHLHMYAAIYGCVHMCTRARTHTHKQTHTVDWIEE